MLLALESMCACDFREIHVHSSASLPRPGSVFSFPFSFSPLLELPQLAAPLCIMWRTTGRLQRRNSPLQRSFSKTIRLNRRHTYSLASGASHYSP